MSGSPLKITPPFGYGEVVPLQKTDRVLLPRGATPEFCRAINALALSCSEFVAAGRDYPIVFASGDAGKTFAPVIVLGFADRQNLFISASGDWEAGAYLPAYVRRYPFCISKIYDGGKPRGERMVCAARSCISGDGVALYDDAGRPTPHWQAVERLLRDYESDLDLTVQMCSILARLELFVPFKFEVRQGENVTFTLQGMHRVDEAKLADLKPATLKALVAKGLMGRIYAHFHSLENFAGLYRRALNPAVEASR